MRILDLNSTDILNTFKQTYSNEIGNQMIIGSEEYTLSLIFAYCISFLVARINTAYNNCNLDTAQGEALNSIGELYSIPREGINTSGKTYLDVCFGLLNADALTMETEFNICGITFKPEVIAFKDGYTIARLMSNDIINENIPIETIRESLDAFVYEHYTDYMYIDAQSLMYPVVNKFDYTEQGDNSYREYIKNNRFINLTGTAKAFEQYVKSLHPSIKDVVVVKQNDEGYVAGTVRIYVIVEGYNKYAPFVCDDIVLDYINKSFNDERVTVIGQTRLPIQQCTIKRIDRYYEVRKPNTISNTSINRFYSAIVNYYNKQMKFGTAFNDSEVQRLMLMTLKDISNDPMDFNLTQADYDAIANVRCVTSASRDGDEKYIKPEHINEYIQLNAHPVLVVEAV